MHFPQIHGSPLSHAAGVTAPPEGEELNLSVSADALPPPLPRGGLGIAENFSSSPEAPLPGELSSEARLRGCTKESLTDMPMAPPLGELAGVSPTERARMLTANPRRCDSIALTKSLPIAAQRFLENGLALSVTFGDTSPKGRGFGRPHRFLYLFGKKSGIMALRPCPPILFGREVKPNGVYFYLYPVRRSECSVLLHLQVA